MFPFTLASKKGAWLWCEPNRAPVFVVDEKTHPSVVLSQIRHPSRFSGAMKIAQQFAAIKPVYGCAAIGLYTRASLLACKNCQKGSFYDFAKRNNYVPQSLLLLKVAPFRHPLCGGRKECKVLLLAFCDTRTVCRFTMVAPKNHFLSMRPQTFHFSAALKAEDWLAFLLFPHT